MLAEETSARGTHVLLHSYDRDGVVRKRRLHNKYDLDDGEDDTTTAS